MTRKLLFCLVLIFLLGTIAPFAAAEVRFELGFGWTLVGPAMNARYDKPYAPPLTVGPTVPPPPDRYISSSASHPGEKPGVVFSGKTAFGMNGFFNILFSENVGLQVLADYHRPGFTGSSPDYRVEMQFLAFGPEPEVFTHSEDWPTSSGNLTETAFSLNALGRFRAADNLSFSLSAGPSVFHFEGKAGYIGYTTFDLDYIDGDYVLSGGTYQMVVAFGPQTKYGFNIGIEAAYEAFHNVILAFDLRWYGAPKTALQMHIVEDPAILEPISEIEATIGLGTLEVNPSYLRAGVAIRLIF